jgi:phenylpyruvate tautomerase PptA (4-oxalocrotonate tautomerase family)
MPIVDIELVMRATAGAGHPPARAIADVLGRVFGTGPGRTWVRVRELAAGGYAENEAPVPVEPPVFVTVLKAHPPAGPDLRAEVLAVTAAVAEWAERDPGCVHVRYEAGAAGRQAFGGRLVE